MIKSRKIKIERTIFFLCLILFLFTGCKKEEEKVSYQDPTSVMETLATSWNANDMETFSHCFVEPELAKEFLNKFYNVNDPNVFQKMRNVTVQIVEDENAPEFDHKNPPSEYQLTINIGNTDCYVPFFNYLVDLDGTDITTAETNLLSDMDEIKNENIIAYRNIKVSFIRNNEGNYVIKNGDFKIDRYDARFTGNSSNLDLLNALSANSMNAFIDYYSN